MSDEKGIDQTISIVTDTQFVANHLEYIVQSEGYYVYQIFNTQLVGFDQFKREVKPSSVWLIELQGQKKWSEWWDYFTDTSISTETIKQLVFFGDATAPTDRGGEAFIQWRRRFITKIRLAVGKPIFKKNKGANLAGLPIEEHDQRLEVELREASELPIPVQKEVAPAKSRDVALVGKESVPAEGKAQTDHSVSEEHSDLPEPSSVASGNDVPMVIDESDVPIIEEIVSIPLDVDDESCDSTSTAFEVLSLTGAEPVDTELTSVLAEPAVEPVDVEPVSVETAVTKSTDALVADMPTMDISQSVENETSVDRAENEQSLVLATVERYERKYSPSPYPRQRLGDFSIWCIASSFGGPMALKAFLRALKPDLPVSFLLVQHIEQRFLSTLVGVLEQNTSMNVKVAEPGDKIEPYTLLITPVEPAINISPEGCFYGSKELWSGSYEPNADQVMESMLRLKHLPDGAIVLTGMGNDGQVSAGKWVERGIPIWVQDPATCEAPSMPEAIIDSHCASVVANPVGLAEKLNDYLLTRTKTGDAA